MEDSSFHVVFHFLKVVL